MLNQKLRLFSYIVMAYMLLAFTWWALLLFTKNRDAYYAKRDLMKIGMAAEGHITNIEEFEQTEQYQKLLGDYQRQEWMIFGEASVFVLTLVAGIWFIHKSYHRQVQANQQQRNFLLAITHELKSPIASIQLVLETLRKRNLEKEKADKLAGSALTETKRLHELVENLLISAKLETAYRPNFEEVNLREMLEELLAKSAGRYPQARISFDPKEPIPLVRIDHYGMTLLINNLISNAIKYSNETPNVQVGLEADDQFLTLTLADQGIGIPEKQKKQIFNKFFRIGNEDTRKTKGTGLGLFIVHQIVKAHKGNIKVIDNQPQGTIFKIEIPVDG